MPRAGQRKCSYCGEYKDQEQICNKTNYCIDCCWHGRAKCGLICPACVQHFGPVCNTIGPYNPRCGLCGYHKSCCTESCQECGAESCKYYHTIALLSCDGKQTCVACHRKNKPGCVHCNTCKKGSKTEITECCNRCNECCDNTGCPKTVRYNITQLSFVKCRWCSRCAVKRSEDKCQRCGEKTVEPDDTILSKLGKTYEITWPEPISSGRNEFKINKSRRYAGLEIETTAYRNGRICNKVMEKWGGCVGTDGSVSGFEARTAPANGDKLIKMLEEICSEFKRAGCLAKPSDNAGLHVHVDASDFYYNDMRKLLMIYARIEREIYFLVDKRRSTGTYARMRGPDLEKLVNDPSTARRDIIAMQGGDSTAAAALKHSNGPGDFGERYYGLNLAPWWNFGTVEFRMHHGTTKADKMIPWALFCIAMLDTAQRVTDREANNWPRGIEGLLKVCPNDNLKWWVALRYQYFKGKRDKD